MTESEKLNALEKNLEQIAWNFGDLKSAFDHRHWQPGKKQQSQEPRAAIHSLFAEIEDSLSELIQKVADLQEDLNGQKNDQGTKRDCSGNP